MTELKYLFSPLTLGPDDWKGYADLKRSRYAHHQIFHGKTTDKQSVLLCVYLFISLIKRLLLGTFQGRFERKPLQAYLDEDRFRKNRRISKHVKKKFFRIVQQAATLAPKFQNKL